VNKGIVKNTTCRVKGQVIRRYKIGQQLATNDDNLLFSSNNSKSLVDRFYDKYFLYCVLEDNMLYMPICVIDDICNKANVRCCGVTDYFADRNKIAIDEENIKNLQVISYSDKIEYNSDAIYFVRDMMNDNNIFAKNEIVKIDLTDFDEQDFLQDIKR
jgi:hypothetical protein